MGDYRTGHNGAMRRRLVSLLLTICLALPAAPAQAWNAAGHRLAALIAWQQLSPPTRALITEALARHPEHQRWHARAKGDPAGIFAEASTWPDDIRSDPRFHDETREPPTPALPGLADTARHKRWHYVDLDASGKLAQGELDRQIERLAGLLRSTEKKAEITHALPWLAHLVADLHQPLHVGLAGDDGGNTVEIENPFNSRQPFTKLHTYWDDLPGAPWLRGRRLEERAARLIERHQPPPQGDVRRWRDESHRLLPKVYPTDSGSLLPIVSEDFHRQARDLADRRIAEAGYRLGRLLEDSLASRVSHETK